MSADHLVYLDNAASTPVNSTAFESMLPYFSDAFGNPSGSHSLAKAAHDAIENARDIVARCIGATPDEIVFTGGGTEADNLAIAGGIAANGAIPVCSAVEHHAVLRACEAAGGRVISVANNGTVDLDSLTSVLASVGPDRVAVVSVMMANNETGVIQPLREVTELVRRYAPNALVHTDAVHAFPWLDVAHAAKAVDLISISAHKFGGPKGVGALVVRGRAKISPILHGGGQERDRRSGTHNVPGIVGMAMAAQICNETRDDNVKRVGALRDRLADELVRRIPNTIETSSRHVKTAGNCHVRFGDIEGSQLVAALDSLGVCASTGSACTSEGVESSHVLLAMGLSEKEANSSVRLTLGATTTEQDVDLAIQAIETSVIELRRHAG
jgi:cysteine desulfurase